MCHWHGNEGFWLNSRMIVAFHTHFVRRHKNWPLLAGAGRGLAGHGALLISWLSERGGAGCFVRLLKMHANERGLLGRLVRALVAVVSGPAWLFVVVVPTALGLLCLDCFWWLGLKNTTPYVVTLACVVLLNAAVQRLCHIRADVPLDLSLAKDRPFWLPEALDAIAVGAFVAADVVLKIEGGEGPPRSSRDVVRWTMTMLSEQYTMSLALLMATTVHLGVGMYRYSCWAPRLRGEAQSATDRNARYFVLVSAVLATIGFAAMMQAVVQIRTQEVPWNSLREVALSMELLSSVTDEQQFRAAAASVLHGPHANVGMSCVTAVQLRLGAWVVQGSALGSHRIVVTSPDGSLTATLDTTRCYFAHAISLGVFKLAVVLIYLAWLLSITWCTQRMFIRPLRKLLDGIIVLGSQLDPDGMLRQEVLPGAAFQHDDNLWVEEAVARTVKSIKLLLKAASRGQALVKQVMRGAAAEGTQGGRQEVERLAMFGAEQDPAASRRFRTTDSRRIRSFKARSFQLRARALPGSSQSGRGASPGISMVKGRSGTRGVDPSGHCAWDAGAGTLQPFLELTADRTWAVDTLAMTTERSLDLVVEMFRFLRLLLPEGEDGGHVRTKTLMEQSMAIGAGSDDGAGVPMVRERTLRRFLEELEARYNDNPYHRWAHAVDVAFSTLVLLTRARSFRLRYLSRLDVFSLMVASLAHDVGHKGLSNAFLVRTRDVLAMTYNDVGVQEKLHASTLFVLCSTVEDANVFESLSPAQFHRARRIIVDAVLDTDMAAHFNRVAELEIVARDASSNPSARREGEPPAPDMLAVVTGESPAAAEAAKSDATGGPRLSPPEVRGILIALLHAADLGNSFKPVHLHAKWSLRVMEEFFGEGRQLQSLRVPIPPLMDPQRCYLPGSQLEFLDIIARPLLVTLSRVLPETAFTLDALGNNFQFWTGVTLLDKRAAGAPEQSGRSWRAPHRHHPRSQVLASARFSVNPLSPRGLDRVSPPAPGGAAGATGGATGVAPASPGGGTKAVHRDGAAAPSPADLVSALSMRLGLGPFTARAGGADGAGGAPSPASAPRRRSVTHIRPQETSGNSAVEGAGSGPAAAPGTPGDDRRPWGDSDGAAGARGSVLGRRQRLGTLADASSMPEGPRGGAGRLRAGDTPQSQLSSRNSVPSTSRRNRHSHLGALFGAHFRSSRNEAGDGWGTLDTAEWAMHVLTCCMLGAAPFDGGDDAVLTLQTDPGKSQAICADALQLVAAILSTGVRVVPQVLATESQLTRLRQFLDSLGPSP